MSCPLFNRMVILLAIVSAIFLFTAPVLRAQTAAVEKDYTIGPEDSLEIKVWENDDLNRTLEVSKEGAITFPLIGKVQAAGLTVFQLEKLLMDRLGSGFLNKPQVTVSVNQYRGSKVYVLGEVKKPGSIPIKGQAHLLDAIADAGGLTDSAGRVVTIVRNAPNTGAQETVEVDLMDQQSILTQRASLTLHGGESVFVSKASRIYVTGEVNKPGDVKWEKGLTVNQAISLAGGATRRGAPNRVKITRTENGKETQLKPAMGDPVMPDDIITVPQSYF